MDWACVPVAASAPVSSSVHRILVVVDMSVLPFIVVSLYRNRRRNPRGAISRGNGEGRYNAATTTMPEGVSTSGLLPDDVSALLRAWTDGDQRALARLTPIVYD